MKSLKILIVSLVLSFGASSAHAGLITFEINTDLDDASKVGTFTGFITFNDADVFAGNSVQASSFVDWAFSWGSESVAIGGGSGFAAPNDTITFDALAQISTWAICVTTPPGCGTMENPGFFSSSDGFLNFATPTGGEFNSQVAQTWTRTQVPEPGTFALLGIGLAGLGLARRRRKV